MKKLCFILTGLALYASSAMPQTFKEWQNLEVNQVNRLPMHAPLFPYLTEEEAMAGSREKASNFLSLNGTWAFDWVDEVSMRPVDFYRNDFNDKSWTTMPVPGLWELNGYGDPVYVNCHYAWKGSFVHNPPFVPEEGNHVGSYRKKVDIPADWIGRRIIANFGSVTSNMYLWVNGRFVGYSEDSKLEAEFDLTPYLRAGENLIAFQVFRWCDGSYLEDQDFFRFSGVARDCFLYTKDRDASIEDLRVLADLTPDYKDGNLSVRVTRKGKFPVSLRLLDPSGREVAGATIPPNGICHEIRVDNPLKWTAETPSLYTLLVSSEKNGRPVEVLRQKVGFRKIEVKGSQILVNGQPVLFKGVNRHEMDPDGGYIVSRERMEEDIKLLKKSNINSVRTCHYPDDSYWYDLCDEYGIYVVAEANLEAHGLEFSKNSRAAEPSFLKSFEERNMRNVQRNFNHPSIVFWSMGNETADSENFAKVYAWIKNEDPSRPVQYEQAKTNGHTDVFCPMYYTHQQCLDYCLDNTPETLKPLIQCEYAHAMGNSCGGFKDYWDLVRKYPKFQGGFIWDFADQAIRGKGKNGVEIYRYGGDFNAYDASDNNFCNNGLFNPDRIPNPHLYEVAHQYQNIWVTPIDVSNGKVDVYNENFFVDLAGHRLEWELLANGEPFDSGVMEEVAVGPQEHRIVNLGYNPEDFPEEKEIFLNVRFVQKRTSAGIPAGHVVAKNQLLVRDGHSMDDSGHQLMADGKLLVNNDNKRRLRIIGENSRIDFDKSNGFISRYEVKGHSFLAEGAHLMPNFWRASTDNDLGSKLSVELKAWKNPVMNLKSLKSSESEKGVSVVAEYELPEVGSMLSLTYMIYPSGTVDVRQVLTPVQEDTRLKLFRFGMKMVMPEEMDVSSYYGRGPVENYSDRKSFAFVGLYRQKASEQAFSYIRPQETGTKSDIRWWKQSNGGGRGLRIVSKNPFSASATHYSISMLDEENLVKGQRHFQEIIPDRDVHMYVDGMHTGVGGETSWDKGARALPAYAIEEASLTFAFRMIPEI